MGDKIKWRDAKALRDDTAALRAEVERLRDALERLSSPARGMTERLPAWAHGIVTAAMKQDAPEVPT